jgi:hypothetical protein
MLLRICSDRYFEHEDAALAWEILDADVSTVGVDSLFRNSQAQAETCLAII